ncbi:MAG: hypothetical protein DRP81_03385 [Candidatus Omnitrophota bacterium]|nr:MAG: hypothetical protein DRP81_03385 [Candidatus Omnitrophota bacterium]
MNRIFTYPFSVDIIEKVAEYLYEKHYKISKDLSNIAVVFGGKRPLLFLRRSLASKIGQPFFSPQLFSMDRFIEYVIRKRYPQLNKISDLDASYLLFNLSKEIIPDFLKSESFWRFFPWIKELLFFLEELDLEKKTEDELRSVEKSAEIGYETPQSINVLLSRIRKIRECFHKTLWEKRKFTRGYAYFLTSQLTKDLTYEDFKEIIFCGFFYLHASEKEIIKNLLDKGKAVLFFHTSKEEWPTFKELEKVLGYSIKREDHCNLPKFHFYSAFDNHSQIGIVREIIRRINKVDDTVIILPQPHNLVPLLSELTSYVKEFNVSLGYPLKRSSIYALIRAIFEAQKTRKDTLYYTKDYLKVLTFPYTKNIKFDDYQPALTRVIVHKIEEYLLGIEEEVTLSKRVFIDLKEIEENQALHSSIIETLEKLSISIKKNRLKEIILKFHDLLFRNFENVENFYQLSLVLENFLNFLIDFSFVSLYSFNLGVVKKILEITEELKLAYFMEEKAKKEEMFDFFLDILHNEVINFVGSPLKGLQILGVFETRSLKFKNVIVMDANEEIYPAVKAYEPLIPRQIFLSLGIDRLERTEEITRYHFKRAVESAENVYLIWQESQDKEKSRFIEEIIWEEEKRKSSLGAVSSKRVGFFIKLQPQKEIVKKNENILRYLKNEMIYSPTSFDVYLRCPLRFFYTYVLRLEEKEDILEESESKGVGNFIHLLLKEFYSHFIGSQPSFNRKYENLFFKIFEERFYQHFERTMKSDAFLLKEVLYFRLKEFLTKEKNRKEVKEIVFVEKTLTKPLTLNGITLQIKGTLDRVEIIQKDDQAEIVVVDYKTGSSVSLPKIKNLPLPPDRKKIKKEIVSFQLPIYIYLLQNPQFKELELNASLYFLKDLKIEYLFKDKDFDRQEIINTYFLPSLKFIAQEILNPNVPFQADADDEKYCERCAFSSLCKI